MPKGPKGQKRPADVIGNAVRVMQIATVEAEEEYDDDGMSSHERTWCVSESIYVARTMRI